MEQKYYERLTLDNCAILLIDYQVGTMSFGISDIDALNLKKNTLWLAEQSKIFDIPTILSISDPDGTNGPLFPELIETLPEAPIINRIAINAWDDPTFKSAVEQTGRKKLIIAGVTVDVCLTFPAISAVAEGYDVYAVVDASGITNQHSMFAAMFRMSQAGVKIANANMVVTELQKYWSLSNSADTATAYGKHVPNFGYISAHLKYSSKK